MSLCLGFLFPAFLLLPRDDEDELRAAFLAEHAVEVRSIDPGDDDFSDLQPLIALIGDAQVVGLGEQTHGDGASFHAKSRLVKFLHQVLGFDVLVWESGMFDCHLVEQALRRGEPMTEAWQRGIFGVWCASEQVQPLLQYVQTTRTSARPLEIAGMDSQMTGMGTAPLLGEFILDLHRRAGEPVELESAIGTARQVFEDVKGGAQAKISLDDAEGFAEAVAEIVDELEWNEGAFQGVASRRERQLAARALRNFSVQVEMSYWMAKRQGPDSEDTDMFRYAALREPAMSETLVWLAREHFPDRKLIVWAASSHLTYNSRSVEFPTAGGGWKPDDADWEPMGNHAKDELGDDLYVIDCIAYAGQIGSVAGWSRPLQAADAGSIDALCHDTGKPYLFLDLASLLNTSGGEWLAEPQVARPRGYGAMRARWSDVCDAFLFTDVMYPSTRVGKAAEGSDG